MNWIDTHPAVSRGDPLGKPLSPMIMSKETPSFQREGWIGARVESYKMRREFFQQLMTKIKLIVL